MEKTEMIAAATTQLEEMNDAGVETLFNIIMMFSGKERWMASTTPERIAELDALEAQRKQEENQKKETEKMESEQREKEIRNQIYHDFAKLFDAIHTVNIPARYDLSAGEIQAIDFICGGVSRCFPEYAFSVANHYFNYGFVKGMRYEKARAKKKRAKECCRTVI